MADNNAGKRGLRGGHVPYGDRYGYQTTGETISHYYGDFVRDLFLGAVAVMLFAAPFYGDSVREEFPFVVVGALTLVCLAALTNPWKKSILTADAVAAGVGMVVYQIWALGGYGIATYTAFVLREAISIIFMFALYFSVKTVRAMVLHQIGKRASIDEFAEKKPDFQDDSDQDDNPVFKIKHAFAESPVEPEEEDPPHKPTFYEKAGD